MSHQRGAVLLISLVFLLVLTMLGVSSMQNATLQEKMAASVKQRNASFQAAEMALRTGESAIQAPGFSLSRCPTLQTCAPPVDARSVTNPGHGGTSGVTWVAVSGGFYALQHFASALEPVHLAPRQAEGDVPVPWTLYRVTGVGIQGGSRTVLESVHAGGRRIMWRQLH